MGDGQHGWAAAEWVMAIRNMFVREEGDRLVLFSGLMPDWLDSEQDISFGPTWTPYGVLTVSLLPQAGRFWAGVQARWRHEPPRLEMAVPGHRRMEVTESDCPVLLEPIQASG